MALVLGAEVGDVFDIGKLWIAVLSVNNATTATLIACDGNRITVSSCRKTEVASGIWIQLGPDPAHKRLRLNFTAPATIPITRRRR